MVMRIATLVSWLLTASLGGYMLTTWVARGGLRSARARPNGLPPPLIFTHGGLAITGLLLWASFTASGWRLLAWLAVGVLMGAIGLGVCTVTLWTPYPTRGPDTPSVWDEAVVVPDTPAAAASPGQAAQPAEHAEPAEPGSEDPYAFKVTDEMIAELLADPFPARHREFRANMSAIIPVVHGFGAITTFVMAVMAASRGLAGARGPGPDLRALKSRSRPLRRKASDPDTAGMGDRNVLGGELEPCGTDPLTGFYRDGCCSTGPEDQGSHTICAVVTTEFLEHQRSIGNDLTTPMPQYRFPGLVPGDRWCVTAVNWLRAHHDGAAAPVVLASTHERTLQIVPLAVLRQHSVDVPADASALEE
jgi:uncharacterized protein